MADQHKQRLIILDSLRGMAALVVFFHHFFSFYKSSFKEHCLVWMYRLFSVISGLNNEAVLFFFVLSGFCIGLSLRGADLSISGNINDYLYRRFKRILPIYWAMLAFSWLVGYLMMNLSLWDYSKTTLLGNLLFLQTSKTATSYWFVPYGLNGPLWTLAYEMFFYLTFPLAYCLNKRYFARWHVIGKFALLLGMTFLALSFNKKFFVPYLAFFSLFTVWQLGYVSAQTFLFKKKYDSLFLILTSLSAVYLLKQNSFPSATIRHIAEGVLFSGGFYIFSRNKGLGGAALERVSWLINRIFYFIGKGSYALYAGHYPFLLLLKYYSVPLVIQIAPMAICFIILCSRGEEWAARQRFAFFKVNYLRKRFLASISVAMLLFCALTIYKQLPMKFYLAATTSFFVGPKSLMILGDSHAASFPFKEVRGVRVVKAAQSGITTKDLLREISKLRIVPSDSFMISIGCNDLRYGVSVDVVENNVRELITAIKSDHPKAAIFLTEIPPIAGSRIALKSRPEFVAALNDRLRSIGKEGVGVVFLSLPERLIVHSHGVAYMDPKFSDDGLHLNQNGYELFYQDIVKYFTDFHG